MVTTRRRPVRWLAVTAIAIGPVVGAAACSSEQPDESVGESLDLSAPGFHEVPPPPLSARHNEAKVWIGDRLVVWGGQTVEESPHSDEGSRLLGDGATLNLLDGGWAPMARSPFVHGLYRPAGAWDGHELVIIGSECDENVPPDTTGSPPPCPKGSAAAAWNPETNSWRRLPAPPIPVHPIYGERIVGAYPVSTIGGDEMAVFSYEIDVGDDQGVLITQSVLTLRWDSRSEEWSTIPAPAWSGAYAAVCSDPVRQQLVVADTQYIEVAPIVPTKLSVLDVGSADWTVPVSSAAVLQDDIVCGDGVVRQWWFGSTPTLEVVATTTGEVQTLDERTPPANPEDVTTVGAWAFIDAIAVDDRAVETVRVDVRRLDGPWISMEAPTRAVAGLGTDSTYVGSGVVFGSITPDSPMSYWRAPPELSVDPQ